MKRKMLIGVLVLVGLLLSGTVQAGPGVIPGDYSTPGDFTTKFWQEKFFGGGAGEPGNVLMAVGQGFVFQNAILAEGKKPVWYNNLSVLICVPGTGCDLEVPPALTLPTSTVYVIKTVYENGRLTLNSSPKKWLTKGSLQDKDVTATNYSFHDATYKLLGFQMRMVGSFDNASYSYDITATFTAEGDNYKPPFLDEDGIMVQKGYRFGATIKIE